MDDERYKYVYSVEEVNKLVLSGMPFRDAYRVVGESINSGDFKCEKKVSHTHEGSIGNLCLDKIESKMKKIVSDFNFKRADEAIELLIKG
jgi:argininosuccinate lyase